MPDVTDLNPAPDAAPAPASAPDATPVPDAAPASQAPASAPAPSAPEAYTLTAPEGRDFDSGVLGAFSDVARELNLTNESAQKVIDKIAPALAEKFDRTVAETRAQWAADAKADPEIGGDKLDENLALAKKATAALGTPDLDALLEASGLVNHPEMLRLLVRAGRAMSEDTLVSGNGASTPADARGLYSASNMNP